MKKIASMCLLLMALFGLLGCNNENTQTPDFRDDYPHNDVYYEVFIRSFADSDGDGIGDIRGMIENFSYFTDLGITGIWMMPFTASNSYHGYSVVDYYAIEEDYGTMEDFEELVEVAKENNVRLMMDLVINHTSDQHEWYKKALAKDTEFYNYYTWSAGGAYSSFVGGMYDLKLSNPVVVNAVYAIGEFWLNKGITGFRLDAVSHFFEPNEIGKSSQVALAENYMFVDKFRIRMRNVNPDVFVISEVFSYQPLDLSFYYKGSDSVINFAASAKLIDTAKTMGSTSYVNSINNIYTRYADTLKNPITGIAPAIVDTPFLRNHDLNRTGSELGNNLAKMKLAAELLLTLPGSPIIYYGEELGMQGTRKEGLNVPGYGVAYDEWRRMPFKWGSDNAYQTTWFPGTEEDVTTKSYSEQVSDPNSLWSTYQRLISVRKAHPALMYGTDFIPASIFETPGLQSYYRTFEQDGYRQAVYVIHNFTSDSQPIPNGYSKILYATSNDLTTQVIPKGHTVILLIPYSTFTNRVVSA